MEQRIFKIAFYWRNTVVITTPLPNLKIQLLVVFLLKCDLHLSFIDCNHYFSLFKISDCRKIEIVQFASRTRQLFVRLLALVKWANSASKVDKCGVSCPYLIV